MERTLRLKEAWTNLGIPLRIKQELFEIGQTIDEKAYWRVIGHLIKQSKDFQEFKQSKEFKEILNTGAQKEENIFFQELEKIRKDMGKLVSNQDLIWGKINNTDKEDETRN